MLAFNGPTFHSIDELHLFSNVAKMVIDMIMPKYCVDYKYIGNEDKYPFQLSNEAIEKTKIAINSARRQYIPSDAFKGSFYGFDPRNSKSIYRSVDYIDLLQYQLFIYVPLFENELVRSGLFSLIRGVNLSLQFSIDTTDLKEIDE